MGERIGRVAFGVGFGAMLGLLFGATQGSSRWGSPLPHVPIDTAAMIGAILGGSFVVVTDFFGLDLPIFPEGGFPEWSRGDGSEKLALAHEQLAALTFGLVFAGLGFLAQLFWAGTAGAFGSRYGGMPLFAIGLGSYAVVWWRGGMLWRILATILSLGTLWLAYAMVR